MKPIDAALEETARQAVILIFSLIGGMAVMALTPDDYRLTMMRLAWAGKKLAHKGAVALLSLEDKADDMYERNRSV